MFMEVTGQSGENKRKMEAAGGLMKGGFNEIFCGDPLFKSLCDHGAKVKSLDEWQKEEKGNPPNLFGDYGHYKIRGNKEKKKYESNKIKQGEACSFRMNSMKRIIWLRISSFMV